MPEFRSLKYVRRLWWWIDRRASFYDMLLFKVNFHDEVTTMQAFDRQMLSMN